jgi:hypothetical protein
LRGEEVAINGAASKILLPFYKTLFYDIGQWNVPDTCGMRGEVDCLK